MTRSADFSDPSTSLFSTPEIGDGGGGAVERMSESAGEC